MRVLIAVAAKHASDGIEACRTIRKAATTVRGFYTP
jgi:hypothetical protein